MDFNSENLDKLGHLRDDPEWEDFFNKMDELEDIAEKINDEMHKDPSDTSDLDARAQEITESLKENKDNWANKTNNKDDYDAVNNSIDDAFDNFNY